MRQSALLLGNGLNRAIDNTAWEDLIRTVHEQYEITGDASYTNFPLAFEQIELTALSNGTAKENDLKKMVAKYLPELKDLSLHKQYLALPFQEIMTTNYDYNLEKAVLSNFDRKAYPRVTKETKHSLGRSVTVEGKRIWHIHGEARYPTTICMGYGHYCAHLARLMEKLGKERIAGADSPYLFHYLYHHGDPNPPWPVLLFTHDIYIVGLALTTVEIDLWWLLSWRKRLMHTHPKLAIANTIHYYFREGECDAERRALLVSMGVELHPFMLVDDNWKGMYAAILKSLGKQIKQ